MQTNDVHYSATVWLNGFKDKLEYGIEGMAEAVLARARITVPRKNGDLSDTGRVEGNGLEREVIYGDENVPYAAYQERGERLDGSHKVRHYTTPGTGSRYLQNAFESVLKEGIGSYIR